MGPGTIGASFPDELSSGTDWTSGSGVGCAGARYGGADEPAPSGGEPGISVGSNPGAVRGPNPTCALVAHPPHKSTAVSSAGNGNLCRAMQVRNDQRDRRNRAAGQRGSDMVNSAVSIIQTEAILELVELIEEFLAR